MNKGTMNNVNYGWENSRYANDISANVEGTMNIF